MPITLLVRAGEESGEPLRLTFDAPRIVVGRGTSCEVRLPDPSVSHRHASIHAKGAEYMLVDEGSTNGTFVGGVKVAPRTSRLVRNGDLVRFGRVWVEIRIDLSPVTRDLPNATRDLALALVSQAMRRIGDDVTTKVRVVEGNDQGKALPLIDEGRVYTIGRGAECDLPLADPDASREHMQVVRRGGVVLVRDLGSKNGVILGETPIYPGRDVPWRSAVMIRVARTVLALDEPVAAALAELEEIPDEPMAQEDAPPAPSTTTVAPPSSLPMRETSAAPVVQVTPQPPPPKKKGGWTGADILVMVIALLILGLSIGGLVWLLRG